MTTLDKLVSAQIDLATASFRAATFSVVLVPYLATLATDVKPQLITSLDEVTQVTSISNTSATYRGLQVFYQQQTHATQVLMLPYQASGTAGADLSAPVLAALSDQASAINTLGSYYGILWAEGDDASKKLLADYCESAKKLFIAVDVNGTSTTDVTTDLAAYVQSKNYQYTSVLSPGASKSFGEEAAFAWVSKGFYYQAGSENWALFQLTGVVAESLTSTERTILLSKNGNSFEPYGNEGENFISLTYKGQVGSGDYIDVIRGRDWLCNAIKTAIANRLLTRPKVPFTDEELSGIKGVMTGVLDNAVKIGFLSPPYMAADGKTVIPSYTINVPRRASISTEDLAERQLTGITFTATLADAIDRVGTDTTTGIQGTLVYNQES